VSAVVLAGLLSVAFVQPASARERVHDNGFEQAECNALTCDCPEWEEESAGTNVVSPVCRGGTGNCRNDGTGPRSGLTWANLGLGTSQAYSYVKQRVAIPDSPAELVFYLRVVDVPGTTGTFAAKINDSTVWSTGVSPSYPGYTKISVDVSDFKGGSNYFRTLKFEATSSNPFGGTTTSFDVDDISVEAPDAPGQEEVDHGDHAGHGDHGPGRITPTILGTKHSETIQGTSGPDVIDAGRGNDKVKAGGGNDIIYGGPGKDSIRGQGGKDQSFGDQGKDSLNGGPGKGDLCDGGAGKDKAAGCEMEQRI
jgi:Ca2+-binding RTX toxin-like protein